MSSGLRLGKNELKLSDIIIRKLVTEKNEANNNKTAITFPSSLTYEIYKKDKFVFRLPKEVGFYFNENDVWVFVSGNKARIGVTDYAQKGLSDIMFFTPPAIGVEIEQFEEAGSIESGKAVFEIVCPVTGTITAINEKLIDSPELINQNPYEQGWIVEMELAENSMAE